MATFINIPTTGIGNVVKFMSLNIAMMGCLVIFRRNRMPYNKKALDIFVSQYIFMTLYSIVAAIVLSVTLTYQPESPLGCILGDIVLYFEMLLSIYFVHYCLTHCSTFEDIYKALDWQIAISAIFGIFQLMALLNIAGSAAIYTALSNVLKLAPLTMLREMQRGVTIFGSEPSSLTTYCLLTVPYILCRLFYGKKNRWLYLLSLIAFYVLYMASNSTQNLVVFFALLLSFTVLHYYKKLYKPMLVGAFVSGLAIAVIMCMDNVKIGYATDASNQSLEYVLFGKIQDRNNYSTQMRASTVINDMKIFSDFILVGVGDGCQGFWYEKNVPSWCRQSNEVSDLISRKAIPNGGGAFFPCYISAYGIIGIFVLLLFVMKYRNLIRFSLIKEDKQMLMIYHISMIILMFSCWYTIPLRETPIAFFILALPLCCRQNNKHNKILNRQ